MQCVTRCKIDIGRILAAAEEERRAAEATGPPDAVTVFGRDTGIRAVCMGRYSLRSSPGVLPPVYRRDEAPHRFLFRDAGNYWHVSTNQIGEGSLRSASAARLISGVMGGKSQWMVRNAVFEGFTVDPNIKVLEFIRAVRVSGHVGAQSGKMGVYELDATHSPKRGNNVYYNALEGAHLHHATEGKWWICNTAQMVAGEPRGWIKSTTASPSPLGLQWQTWDGSTHTHDPRLTVTKVS